MRRIEALVVLGALIAGAIALAVALWPDGRGDTPLRSASEVASAASPSASPIATSTPTIDARPITIRPDIDFPPDTMMLVVLGPYGKGVGPFSLMRAYRLGDDPVELEVLFPPEAVAGNGYAGNVTDGVAPTGFMVNPVTRSVVAGVCYGTACGHEGGTAGIPVRTVFYESGDGGSSWSEIGALDGEWFLGTFHRERLVVVNVEGQEIKARLIPGGEGLDVPAGFNVRYGPPLLPGGSALFAGPDRESIVNDIGGVEFRPDFSWPFDLGPVTRLTDFLPIAAGLTERETQPYDPKKIPRRLRSFIGLFGAKGDVRELFELPRDTNADSFAGMTREQKVLATFQFSGRRATCTAGGTSAGAAPAIFDPATAEVRFILAPFLNSDCPGGSQRVLAFREGGIARVDTPGDCLNLREMPEADARVITCIPHGTIVHSDGTVWHDTWIDVSLFDGREGWAALPYVDAGPRRPLPSAALKVVRENLPPGPASVLGTCYDFGSSGMEGWCYQKVGYGDGLLTFRLGVTHSHYGFVYVLRANPDGSFTLISRTESSTI